MPRSASAVPALLILACAAPAAAQQPPAAPAPTGPAAHAPFTVQAGKPVADLPGEAHLKNVRQLTFGGENAEAYWAGDGRRLVLQSRSKDMPADQIYVLDLATGTMQMVSTGKGRTTCSYFTKGDRSIVFASTHHHGDQPPMVKVERGRYVWAVHREYDLFTVDVDGKNLRQLTDLAGYDAEATVCPVSGDIVFTSTRDGDLELYTMKADGTGVHRVTSRPGYDGGAFFSPDGKRLVLRSACPADDKEAAEDRELLGQALVRPSRMEITVCDRDGSNFRQLTHNGAANFAPYWLPGDKKIIFSSNFEGMRIAKETGDHTAARNFDLFLMDDAGGNIEQITRSPEFDGFPMFSPDGTLLVFASNRYGKERGETNIFVAEWVDRPAPAPADSKAPSKL